MKKAKVFLAVGFVILLLTICFLKKRENDREIGEAHGYTTGYSLGYADYLQGRKQIATKLAGEIVPYEVGSGKWKYFMMGFADGYEDGFSGEGLWYTDAS